jgi:hypothetical protein
VGVIGYRLLSTSLVQGRCATADVAAPAAAASAAAAG